MTEKEAIRVLYNALGDDILGNVPRLSSETFEAIRVAIRILNGHIRAEEEQLGPPLAAKLGKPFNIGDL
jgi:hypothetical protein